MQGFCALLATKPYGQRIDLSTDKGLTHAYGTLAQTVTGTIGASFFTASSTLATASIRTGSIIHVTASDHVYTVTSVAGTTLNVTPVLTQNYVGSSLKVDAISAFVGRDGFGSSATQGTAAAQPAYIPALTNGLDTIEFPGATKALSLAANTAYDDVFATGGTIMFVLGVNDAGTSGAGRIVEKLNGGGTAIWNLLTTSAGGGFCKLLFNYVTSGTAGVFTTTGAVVALSIPQLVTISYDASNPGTAPVMRIIGLPVNVDITTPPTGTATSDAGGAHTIGNRAAGDRAFNGRLMVMKSWKRVLKTRELERTEKTLMAKWGVTPYFDRTGTVMYVGGRLCIYAEPPAPVTNAPLVIFLHGGTGTAATFATQLATGPLLGDVVIRVFLTATENAGAATTWNSNSPPPTFNNAPDSDYIASLINYFVAQGKVDPTKVFVVGHSNGAMMAYRMAIEHPTLITGGVFALAGVVMVPNPNTYTGKIRHFHGADDANIPIAGGVGLGGNTYPVPQTTVTAFTAANSGGGVSAGTALSDDFIVLPSPAEHTVASLTTALTLAPYSTTLQQEIATFVTT